MHALVCPSIRICYGVGDASTIVGTSDGGRTWQLSGIDPAKASGCGIGKCGPGARSIACTAERTCFATVGCHIVVTRDASQSWTDTGHVPINGGDLRSIACPTARSCFVIGYGGMIASNTRLTG